MAGTGHVQIRCPVAGFIHFAHLPRRRDGVARLEEQRGDAHRLPLLPVVTGAPLGGDLDPVAGVPVQAPAGRGPVERLEEVLAGHLPELVVNLLGRIEFGRQRVQPRLPRPGGAPAEVRRHVLHHQRADKIGSRSGQTPRVQRAHRMADQDGRPAQRGDRVAEIGHEPLGADRIRVGDVAAAVPRRVVGVHLAEPRQPRQLTRPGAAPSHQPVHQDQRIALAAAGASAGRGPWQRTVA